MKITAIRGRGLASLFDPFEILLDRGPLAQCGLYSISGQTGAGKSTILDAMCLGLFGETPRLRGRGKSKIGKVGPDQDDLRLSDRDPRALLSRGCGEGFAEVEFVGVDKERYRSRWSIRRSRRSSTGRLQKASIDLFRVADDRCLSDHTTSKTLAAISSKLGLSFDQFCRSVLLAQGDFAAFLRADDKERADLLERMTGTEVYRKLSIACHLRNRDEQKEVGSAMDALKALELWSPEKEQAVKQELLAAKQAEKEAKTKLEAKRGLKQALVRRAELEQRYAQAQAQLASDKEKSEAAKPDRVELEALLAVQTLRPLFERELAQISRREAVAKRLAQSQSSLVEEIEALKEAQASLAKAKKAQAQLRVQIEQAKPQIQAARALDTRIAQLRATQDQVRDKHQGHQQSLQRAKAQVQAQHKALAELSDRRSAFTRTWPAFEASVELFGRREELLGVLDELLALQGKHRAKRAQLEQAQAQEEKLRAQLQQHESKGKETKLQLEKLQTQLLEGDEVPQAPGQGLHQALSRAQLALGHAKDLDRDAQRAAKIMQSQREAAQLRQKLEASRAQIHAEQVQRRSEIEKIELRLHEAESIRDEASAVERMQQHRELLTPGKPCPLCGATEHPGLGETATQPSAALEVAQKRVAALQAELKTQGQILREQDKREVEIKTRLEASEAQGKQDKVELESLAPKLVRALEGHESFLDSWPAGVWTSLDAKVVTMQALDARLASNPQAPEALQALAAQSEARIEGTRDIATWLEAQVQAAERMRQEAARLRERQGKLQKELDLLVQQQRWLDQALAEQRASKARATSEDESLVERSKGLKARLVALWKQTPGPWSEGIESLQGLVNQVRVWIESIKKAIQEQSALHEQSEAHQQALLQSTKQVEIEERLFKESESSLDAQSTQLAKEQGERAALLGGQGVEQIEARNAQQGEQLERNAERWSQSSEAKQLQVAQLTATCESLESQHKAVMTELEQSAKEFVQHSAALGQPEAELRAKLGVPVQHRKALQEKIAQLDRALAQSEARYKSRSEDLEKDRQDARALPDAEQVDQELAQASQSLEAVQRTLAQLEMESKAQQDKIEKQRELEQAHQAQLDRAKRWGQLNALIGHSEGHRFQRFAQGLSLERLLLLANRHLHDIDRRYRIARVQGDSLDLQVVDTMMGDEIRSIHSLSGGESFLVSLALALGLSSLSAMHTRVESLFIDEGFGTLDRESLEQVLAALDALQATGRQVGLISHVEGMAEQLGGQISVQSCGHGKSKVLVRGSEAR